TYIFFVVFFQLLPLDLTARLGTIYDQFQNGKIILIPFSSWYSLNDFLCNLPVGIVWIPVGWILVTIYQWSFFSGILFTLIVSFLIELFQIFIYSRITDINDVIISILGCILGSSVAFYGFNKGFSFFSQRFILIQISFIVWIFVIINKFWFPFNFMTDYFYIVSRIKSVNLIPLRLYIEKPYLYSLFNMVEVVLYFIPLGIIFFLFVRAKMTKDNYKVIFFVFTIGICFFAGLVEFGQIFIPSRYPDITDWLLMIVGGFIGFLFFQLISFPNSGGSMKKT
ncbi:MAG: VanZ family protein, partial [Ignavibacteria bacterium]|nr:VanZ family protein [Ignavibacteria bacterium]